MPLLIYHNPRCSKSRQTLAILEESGADVEVVEYLKNPPDAETIGSLAQMLGLGVASLMRTGEDDYRQASDLPAADDDVALANWLSAHPRVLQRPIVVDPDAKTAVIGRPPENVRELLYS